MVKVRMSFLKGTYILELILVPILRFWYPISCKEINVNINGEILELMLQQAKQLKGADFVSWKIEGGVPVLVGVNQLHEDNSQRHIILERLQEDQEYWNLSYWISKYWPQYNHYITDQDDFTVAAYTMALDQILNENSEYHYSRECKGVEDGHLVDMLNTCLTEGTFKRFSLRTRKRRFVLLEEQNCVVIRQASPMGYYLHADSCAVLYSENVYVFYGNMMRSDRLRSAANVLGNLVKEEVQKYNPDVRYIEIEYGVTEGLSAQNIQDMVVFYDEVGFYVDDVNEVPVLSRFRHPNTSIIQRIWEGQQIYTLSKDTDDKDWFTSVKTGPLLRSMLKTDECHIVLYREKYHDDMFFLWIGTESTSKDRIRAAIKVEQTVETFYRTAWDGNDIKRMTVPVIVEGKEPLEFKAIFMDWIDKDNHKYIAQLVDTIQTESP